MDTKTEWLTHLIELRKRLIYSLFIVAVIFLVLFYFANDLYHFIAIPLLEHLTPGNKMIATTVAAPFLVPLKLSLFLSIAIAMPFVLFHLWKFVAPGLYNNEKNFIWPLIFSSTLLFYLGVIFCYLVVLPLLFKFFINTAPQNVAIMTDINAYLGFVLRLFFAFGVAFEVPIFVLVIIKSGLMSYQSLKRKRPYIIVLAFIVGMILTPPDVLSQILLAIPIWLLFELGLLLARLVLRGEKLAVEN